MRASSNGLLALALMLPCAAGAIGAGPAAQELARQWENLKSDDAQVAERAAESLILAGGATVALAREELKPKDDAVTVAAIQLQIASLGDDKYANRERAQNALLARGFAALYYCREAVRVTGDAEIRSRLREIIARLPAPPRSVRDGRLAEVLLAIGTPEARELATQYRGWDGLPTLEAVRNEFQAPDAEWNVLGPRVSRVLALLHEGAAKGADGAEMMALRKALANPAVGEAKLKEALSAVRAAPREDEPEPAELQTARRQLMNLLTIREEAQLVVMGVLK